MATRRSRTQVAVLGDLVLDVVLAADRPIQSGTDVPGRVSLRHGGSAATVARWLARLGVRTTLICAVGRDPIGRSLIESLRAAGVTVWATRSPSTRTGRIGVLVTADGERSFVADRGAADTLGPEDVRPAWFDKVDLLHLPAYSLLGEPLGGAGRRAIELARAVGALVAVDVASIGPLLASGRRAALATLSDTRADLLFATEAEARALAGDGVSERLLELAPIVVLKRGAAGASILVGGGGPAQRYDVATRPFVATDTTGAGDAFDAGFIAAWLGARREGLGSSSALRRAALAGNRSAARQLIAPRGEFRLG